MNLRTAFILPLVLFLAAMTEPDPVDPVDPTHGYAAGSVEVEVKAESKAYPYRIYRPAEIAEGQELPLVVFLHGMGERGSDNIAQLRHFPVRVVREEHFKRHPCIVLAPQCPSDDTWTRFKAPPGSRMPPTPAMQGAIAAIREAVKEHPVDTSRIYLVGLSMGGYGTWELAARHPDWFAAIVPVCGGGDPTTASRLARVPTWAFHGTDDTVVPEQQTIDMVEAIRAAGGTPAYTALDGVGHGSWPYAYGPRGAMEWMFAQRKPSPPDLEK